MKKILILGVNGFIGHHLSQRIIKTTDWEVYGMDMQTERVADLLKHPRFHFFEGDITINKEWIEYHIRKCDTILPLVAIATPATYVKEPLRVFELDFEPGIAHIAQDIGAAPADVGPRQHGPVEQGDDAVVFEHRGARYLFHEAWVKRTPHCAPGVVRPEAEQKGGACLMALQRFDEARYPFAGAAIGVDVDLQRDFHFWRREGCVKRKGKGNGKGKGKGKGKGSVKIMPLSFCQRRLGASRLTPHS